MSNIPSLPRRVAHSHLEPQLRERHGKGDGTPFTPFPAAETPDETPDRAAPVPAQFRNGTRRARSPKAD